MLGGWSGELGLCLDETKTFSDFQVSVLCFVIRVKTGNVPAKFVLDGSNSGGILRDDDILDSFEFKDFNITTAALDFICVHFKEFPLDGLILKELSTIKLCYY